VASTEFAERCELWKDAAVSLVDSLDELDVIRILEQHFPDHQRYQVDRLVEQIDQIRRDAYLDA
jgi:hypothetical protein